VCDSVDNNCDGQVDEGCACSEGQTQPCYSGPQGTANKGACAQGQQTCDVTGTWGPCVGQVLPKKEDCNGVDDDCNGSVDDMGKQTCGVGECKVEVEVCQGGKVQACVPKAPTPEICDGKDNNCNQLVDEIFPEKGKTCQSGNSGLCGPGKYQCKLNPNTSQVELFCVADVPPAEETCNGVDDDCNGIVDDNIPGTGGECSSGLPGVCSQGSISCKNGVIDCFAVVDPSPEKCNGLDDNCNGTTDEGDPEGGGACDSGLDGICGAGTQHCVDGVLSCVQNSMPSAEACNGLDDDCNGIIDNGNPGGGQACGCGGKTLCALGKLICQGGPVVYFEENFGTPAEGWDLGSEWQIDVAKAGPSGNCADPGQDTTPTADGKLAGVNIGGCSQSSSSKVVHDYYWLTSPAINTANAPAVFLQYQRFLKSDTVPYMTNSVQVYDGTNWNPIWTSTSSISDAAWQKQVFDISTYKGATMKIRWGFKIDSTSVLPMGSWSLDDILVTSSPCP
jgi:hypothetical protein